MTKPTIKPEQEIDAIAMVRAIRDAQATQIQGMTTEQQVAFYRAKAEDLLESLLRLQPTEQLSPMSHLA